MMLPCSLARCSLSAVAAIWLLASSLAPALAEQRPKVGYLGFGAAVLPTLFQNRLRELGYSEGTNVSVEYRFAEGRAGALPRLAREVDARVDVIMAMGDEAIVAAKNATRTVPVVMVACDAVTTGFVASLARPGGNLTGVTCLTSEVMPKRLAVFRELLPSATRIAILYNPENVSKPPEAAHMVELAKDLGLDGKAFHFRTAEDIERAFSTFSTAPVSPRVNGTRRRAFSPPVLAASTNLPSRRSSSAALASVGAG